METTERIDEMDNKYREDVYAIWTAQLLQNLGTQPTDATNLIDPAIPRPIVIRGNKTALDRLYWRLDGALEQSVFVMPKERQLDDDIDLNDLQSLVTSSGLHVLASERVMTMPIATLTVQCNELIWYQSDWDERHSHCDGDPGREFEPIIEEGRESNGELPDGDDEDEDGLPLRLIRCCGTDRPSSINSITTVHAQSSSNEITVLDYVTEVHPWLMSQKQDILASKIIWGDVIPEGTKPIVNCYHPHNVLVRFEREWLQDRKNEVNFRQTSVGRQLECDLMMRNQA